MNPAQLQLITGALLGQPQIQYPQIVGANPWAAIAGLGQNPQLGNFSNFSGMSGLDLLDRAAYAGLDMSDPSVQQAINAAIAQKIASTSVLTTMGAPTKARQFPLGFDSGPVLIPALGTASVINNPQVVFKTERLVVPSDIGGSFVIDDVIVGKNSQFASNAVGIPARTFDERGVGVGLAGDTAQISQNVIIKVTNTSGAPARFRATIIGPAVE